MGTGEQLGPGTHSPLHVERVFEPINPKEHGSRTHARRNVGGGGAFSKTPLTRHLRSLKEVSPTMLPSFTHSPGPGAYTQFSSFGQASGGSRENFYPRNRGNQPNSARSAVATTPRK